MKMISDGDEKRKRWFQSVTHNNFRHSLDATLDLSLLNSRRREDDINDFIKTFDDRPNKFTIVMTTARLS